VEHLVWYTDSELLARQWQGVYAVRSPHLRALMQQARQLATRLARLEVHHHVRELNRAADRLAKQGARQASAASPPPDMGQGKGALSPKREGE
jgi:ribonuclease HI